MSSRDSLGTGDLIPQDVIEVFAQEKLSKRGHKKRSNSLGRALGWLKGKKRKDLSANGRSVGLGPGPDLDLDGHPAGHQAGQKGVHKAGKQTAVPKQEDEEKVVVPPLFQENVFIEASRPKYLEDLHTEAQEGLKLLQQEETNNGEYYQDDESTISTVTVQPEDDSAGFLTDSTIPDASSTVSTQSNVSTRSSRSGLSRQGSTFRPLNSGKKPEKAKTRRRSRKTVVGIPHHVQKELGLDRVGMAISPTVDEEQLPNGETIDTPTSDGPHTPADLQERTSVSLQNIKVLQSLSEGQVQQFSPTQAVHRDDLALLQRFGPELSDLQRPRSLAVPWMTTANSLQPQPPSPVVSMSPQAPYLSKIIPNAVMPPAIDVVEISRGRSRNSLRTVSKSSVLLASPASSRASSRASTLSSASKYKSPKLSDSSCWSHSESSETLVSESSTISSSSTPRERSQVGDLEGSAKEDKVSVHSSISRASKSTSNGKPRSKANEVKKEGPFVRNLSVMKSKKAPPPPSRSYSLHNKMNRRSRDLTEVKVISGKSSPQSLSASGEESGENKPVQIKEAGSSPMPTRTIDSPGYTADTSSMDESTDSISPIKTQLQTPGKEEPVKVEEPVPKDTSPEKQQTPPEKELKKIVSPSSGYSSQDGTPTQPSKRSHSSSPRHKKGILAKLQSLFPGPTPASAGSAPSPPTQPEATETTQSTEPPQPQPNPSADTVTASPSVRALRELFNIPPPPKVHAPPPPPPEVWAHNKRTFELLLGPPAPDNTYAIVKKNPKDRRQQRLSPSTSKEGSVKSLSGERKKDDSAPVELNSEVHRENNERLAHVEQHVDVKGNSKVTEKDEKVRVSGLLSGMLAKVAQKREQRLAAMQQEEAKLATHSLSVTEVKTKVDTLPAITLPRVSPAPSPPPAHHPPQPPTKQDTQLGTSDVVSALAPQSVVSPRNESSWPPPPPPMEQASGKLPGGHDEMDLPLPPPPLFSEEGLVTSLEVPPEQNIPNTAVLQKSNNEKLDSTCTATSVMATEVILLKPSGEKPVASEEVVSAPQLPPPATKFISQGIPPPPETIPPPPPYAAPSAPIKEVSPPPPKVVFHPPSKAVFPPPPKEISPPPPKEISPPPSKEVCPPPPKEVSPPPSQEVSPPPPKEVSPSPPKEVSPPPPKEIPPPPIKEVFPPPPTAIPPPPPKEVSPPPPKEVSPPPPKEIPPPPIKEVFPPPPTAIPPPPPKEVSPPPPQEVSPPPLKEVSPPPPKEVVPPPPKMVSPPPPKEVFPPPPTEIFPLPPKEVPPPPPKEISPPPAKDVSPPPLKEVSPPLPKEVPPPPPKEVSPLPPKEVCLMPVTEVSLPPSEEVLSALVPEVSPPAPKEVSPPSAEEVAPLSSQEVTPLPSQEATYSPVSSLSPPQSIPPPPPSELLPPPEVISPHSDGNHPAAQEPPPPPSELPVLTSPETSPAPHLAQGHAPPPPVNIPLPPPVQAPANITHQPTPLSTEIQSQEQTSSLSLQEEATPMITPSLLQVVKLRSVSPDPTKPQDQTQSEVTMRTQKPSNQGSTPSASGEAPQKPIRKSLIMTSPTSISPPVIITSPPAVSKAQATVVLPTSSSTVFPSSKKSPPAITTSPSMNLQEAIRLRTAARTKDGPPSRLSLHSPTSPLGGDIHRSPSSTASFIFSKSTKKVVIETVTSPEAKSKFQKNLVAELSSVTKSANDEELTKKGVKVPPPVAKKPKAKAKEMESSVETEKMQTAGQEAQPEGINGTQEKPNETAGSVEGEQTSST